MKTVTIPFDLEMAKKIQSGEVKGKIVDKIGIEYEIAKDVLAGLVSAHQPGLTDAVYDSLEAIKHADKLIKRLKSK